VFEGVVVAAEEFEIPEGAWSPVGPVPDVMCVAPLLLRPRGSRARLRTGLLLQDRLRWPRSGYWIGVTMDDLPLTVFTSKYGRHAKRKWRGLVGAADL
jgi:hypothetical protein